MDIKVYVKNSVLYLDYGYIREGDIQELQKKIIDFLPALPSPFQTISLYDRAISMNCLPVPQDEDGISYFGDFMSRHGRDLSIWVISPQNLLYKSLSGIAKGRVSFKVAGSIEEAEQIVEEHRLMISKC